MKRFAWLLAIIIFACALLLRLYHFENRTPFEWDQNRDYGEITKIAGGEYVALGPIAKGTSGGFYLGPLYYYLLYPAYVLLQGNLSSLPVTSIVIDAALASLCYILLRKPLGNSAALILAIIWTLSWFFIEWSRVSWNVALVPLWSLTTLYALYESIEHKSKKHFYLLALLAGLTIHIHVATIPVIPVFLALFFRRLSFSLRVWIQAIVLSLMPGIPLIISDLNHNFANLHLLRDFLTHHNKVTTPWSEMPLPTLTKLGKVVSGIATSTFRDNLALGIVTIILAIKAVCTKNTLVVLSGIAVVLTWVLTILLRDPGFPEYYFAPAYVALCIIFIDALLSLFRGRARVIVYLLLILAVIINMRAYTTAPTGFSLAVKEQIVESLEELEGPLDVHYAFDPGREGGLRYLVERSPISLDPQSPTRILITDKLNTPLYIEGELTRDLLQIGNIRTALYIVQ